MTARPLYKTDELARANERIHRLEGRITDMAVELLKAHSRLKAAHDQILRQQAAIEHHENNARKFHAQVIQARVKNIVRKES